LQTTGQRRKNKKVRFSGGYVFNKVFAKMHFAKKAAQRE